MKNSRSLLVAPFLLAPLFFSASGCSDSPGDAPPDDQNQMNQMMMPPGDPPVDPASISYYKDIQPLMERYCTGCHQAGDIAPFALTDYAAVSSHALVIKNAVSAGLMPPWMPSDASLPLRYSRKLRPEDKKLLLDWIDAGAKAGDPTSLPRTDIPPAETATPPRADVTLKAKNAYRPAPPTGQTDDYHCFIYDPMLDHDRFLTAGEVHPDNRPIVHHMALYLVPPASAAAVQALDTTGNGYTCFGSAAPHTMTPILLAWAPGGTSMRTPADTAFRVPKGSLLVMQMHYNTLADNGKADQTNVVLELTDTAPTRELLNLVVAKTNLLIPAGEMNSVQTLDAPVSALQRGNGLPAGDMTVYGYFPHMHLLGTRIATSTQGGPMMVEIPRWDFHWQATYTFATPFILKTTDTVHLECNYDNSAAHQPMVGGVQQMPKDVKWGEGTTDEMCVGLFLVAAK